MGEHSLSLRSGEIAADADDANRRRRRRVRNHPRRLVRGGGDLPPG